MISASAYAGVPERSSSSFVRSTIGVSTGWDRRHPWRILVPEETLTKCHTMPEEPVLTRKVLSSDNRHDVDILGQQSLPVKTPQASVTISFQVDTGQEESNNVIKRKRVGSILDMLHRGRGGWLDSSTDDSLDDEAFRVYQGIVNGVVIKARTNPAPHPYVPPTNKELEMLFQPMFDEYFNPPGIRQDPIPNIAQDPSYLQDHRSIAIDLDAPSGSHTSSPLDHHSSSVHQGVAGEQYAEVNPFAAADPEPFVNVFAQTITPGKASQLV
ncbi:hypothetical protein Tco_0803750 [Tanacetum coccineum]|uniref:Uncharacterized protein n=1 Tax=Tanacetum coccineum TaxID=301880 RepID=A0ABQ5A3F7_9ASTR